MTATLATPFTDSIQYRAATITALPTTEERIVELRAVPYNVETRLGPRLFESFQPKAFAAAGKDPARTTLWSGHSNAGGTAVGRALAVEDRSDHVFIRALVSNTRAGDDLLTLARDGVLGQASIEFQPMEEFMQITRRGDDMVVRHKRGHLLGVALVPHGAYGDGAPVTSVRDLTSDRAREEWLARLRGRTS